MNISPASQDSRFTRKMPGRLFQYEQPLHSGISFLVRSYPQFFRILTWFSCVMHSQHCQKNEIFARLQFSYIRIAKESEKCSTLLNFKHKESTGVIIPRGRTGTQSPGKAKREGLTNVYWMSMEGLNM